METSPDEQQKRQDLLITLDGGIFPMFEAFYIEAIMYSAGRAKDAFLRLDRALQQSEDAAAIVAIAHEACTHVAGLSRFFWPASSKDPNKNRLYRARAQKLRNAFGLDESSVLYNRDLRNALEHFDEYLDNFLLQDLVGNFYPAPIVGAVSRLQNLDHVFRFLDPELQVFVLFGKQYSFALLSDAINEILSRTEKMKSEGWQLV